MRKSILEIWEKNCVHNFLVGTILGPAAVAWKRWLVVHAAPGRDINHYRNAGVVYNLLRRHEATM